MELILAEQTLLVALDDLEGRDASDCLPRVARSGVSSEERPRARAAPRA